MSGLSRRSACASLVLRLSLGFFQIAAGLRSGRPNSSFATKSGLFCAARAKAVGRYQTNARLEPRAVTFPVARTHLE